MNTFRKFSNSFRHARRGLLHALAVENSFRIHLAVAMVVVVIALALGISSIEWAILLFLVSSILSLELVNTVVERFVDILEPRVHPYAGLIKDLVAAAVLITSVMAVIVGILILGPYLRHGFGI